MSQAQVQVWKREISLDEIRFWVYGDSGVGKTRFAATWPDPLFLLADQGGLMSVERNVAHIDVTSWADLQDAWRYLKEGKHSHKTLVLDTLNEIQYLAMQNTLTQYPEIKRSYKSLPGKSDYGKALYDFELMVRSLLKFPMHVVLISQLKKKEFETDPILPQLTGKNTATNLAKLMSVIGFMYRTPVSLAEGGTRVLPIVGFNEVEHQSKDRTGLLPDVLIEPTYAKCFDYWKHMSKS